MTKSEKISQLISTYADILHRDLTNNALNVYKKQFDKYDYKEIESAFDQWANDNSFFPTPSEIISIIRENKALDIERNRQYATELYSEQMAAVDWDKNLTWLERIKKSVFGRV